MRYEFSEASRKSAIGSILAVFVEKINSGSDSKVVASCKETSYLKIGFSYKFKICIAGEDADKAKDVDTFYAAKDYVSNMFTYLFNGKLDVSSWCDDNKFEAEFEVVSEI